MDNLVLRSHLALLLAMLLWGSSFIALKLAVNDLSPMIVIFMRMAIGAVAFLSHACISFSKLRHCVTPVPVRPG